MDKITIFTSKTCTKCPEAEAVVEDVVKEVMCEVEHVDIETDIFRALENQIATVPSIMVNNNVISRGEVPKREDIISILKGNGCSREIND